MANNKGPCRGQYKVKETLGLRQGNEPQMGRGISGQAEKCIYFSTLLVNINKEDWLEMGTVARYWSQHENG